MVCHGTEQFSVRRLIVRQSSAICMKEDCMHEEW